MATFINLTNEHGKDIFINADKIVHFFPSILEDKPITEIIFELDGFFVKEDCETVMRLIELSQKEGKENDI